MRLGIKLLNNGEICAAVKTAHADEKHNSGLKI